MSNERKRSIAGSGRVARTGARRVTGQYTGAPSEERVGKDAAAPEDLDEEVDPAGARGLEICEAAAPVPGSLRVEAHESGARLDRMLAGRLPRVSRTRIQTWIETGAVRLNGAPARPRAAVFPGDTIALDPPPDPAASSFAPEPMALAVVHEDESILVLDKPAGLVVHPAAGHWSGTLLNGLLAHDPRLARLPRAGIVHRLDADTTGLMVVARTAEAQFDLVRQLQARTVVREYWAIVFGATRPAFTIDAALARDPRHPLRFKVSRAAAARAARTHVRTVRRQAMAERGFSWIACRLETGRTHQIRVHLESVGHPLVGDPLYRERRGAVGAVPGRDAALAFPRQALHAARLGFVHPASGRPMQWYRPPPADMRALMRALGFRFGARPVSPFSDGGPDVLRADRHEDDDA